MKTPLSKPLAAAFEAVALIDPSRKIPYPPRFSLGQIVSTPGALEAFNPDFLRICLYRHSRADWGELDEHDREANEEALAKGFRLLSTYRDAQGAKLWIITEADRSVTTLLLPEEY